MKIDHITFVAKTLEQADAYASARFGVRLPPGGRHPLMGTHNLLARIAPDVFLEFIAIDPAAVAPARPRWFALDRLEREGGLASSPRLFGWVASLPGLTASAGEFPGMESFAVTRDDLRWDFCMRTDGEAEAGGVFPAFIDWGDDNSPVARMRDVGIRLERFRLAHPEIEALSLRLQNLGWTHGEAANRHVRFERGDLPELLLELQTPKGRVRIHGGNL